MLTRLSFVPTAVLLAAAGTPVFGQQQYPAVLAGHATLPAVTLLSPPADAPPFFMINGRFTAPDRGRVEELETLPSRAATSDPAVPRMTDVKRPLAGQPAQGISGIHALSGDAFLLLSDNGTGSKANGMDSLLMVHQVRANWQTGALTRVHTVFLRDPDKRVPFAIRNEITAERYLTGSDFDPESLRQHGDRWFIGDEFGPYVLQTDLTGRVLSVHETRVDGVTVHGPDHHRLGQLPDTPGHVSFRVSRSKGFEPLAVTRDGRFVIAMFEAPLWDPATNSPESRAGRAIVRMIEFDVAAQQWTGRSWLYALEDPAHVVSDLAMVDGTGAVLIERDNTTEGSPSLACNGPARADCFNRPARFKRVYKIDLARTDDGGFVRKSGYIDLLNIADPHHRAHAPKEPDGRFMFPFSSPEGLAVIDADHIAVINDNNLPSSSGRRIGKADDSELIVLRVPELLRSH